MVLNYPEEVRFSTCGVIIFSSYARSVRTIRVDGQLVVDLPAYRCIWFFVRTSVYPVGRLLRRQSATGRASLRFQTGNGCHECERGSARFTLCPHNAQQRRAGPRRTAAISREEFFRQFPTSPPRPRIRF